MNEPEFELLDTIEEDHWWFVGKRLILRSLLGNPPEGERLLDLGCATKPFRRLYSRYARESVGIDVPGSLHAHGAVDVFADGMPH